MYNAVCESMCIVHILLHTVIPRYTHIYIHPYTALHMHLQVNKTNTHDSYSFYTYFEDKYVYKIGMCTISSLNSSLPLPLPPTPYPQIHVTG